jgi:hypothetical protein
MKVIFKYPIQIEEKQNLMIPEKFEILAIKIQNGMPYIWALVDNSLPLSQIPIRIYPTGATIDQSLKLKYCNTFELLETKIVFHVFIEEAVSK